MTTTEETAALIELEALRTESLRGLRLDGRWVPQLSSKSVGTTDPNEVAANGSHTFYAADILADYETRTYAYEVPLLVLKSTDFGKGSRDASGQPYWVLLVDEFSFSGRDEVTSWCQQKLAPMSTEEVARLCVPRALSPVA